MEKIIIFGAGNTGLRAYEQSLDQYQILCFLDNDEKKWGTYIKGISVIKPTLEHINLYRYDFILIASVFGKQEIEAQLIQWGIHKEKIRDIAKNPDVLSPFLKSLAEDYEIEGVEGSVAEVGVFQGESAEKINQYFSNRTLHLFDTFTGFDGADVRLEKKHSFSNSEINQYNNTSVGQVMGKMPYPLNVVIHKGYFPDTAIGIIENFCFVRIDIDLYAPTAAALDFFHPLMSNKGCILIHDYFGESYKGIKKAVNEYLEKHIELSKLPIGDTLSIAIVGF